MGILLVTGASGLLGKKILSKAPGASGWHLTTPAPGTVALDATDRVAVERFFAGNDVATCVHCAADADIKSCENDPQHARRVNVDATRNVAKACGRHGARLILVSTDYVFDGNEAAYNEASQPKPLQVYGRTKLEAERIALSFTSALVVRLPLLYGFNDESDKTTWPREVAMKLRAGETVSADTGEVRQPTMIDDVARVVLSLAGTEVSGLLHVAAGEGTTKYNWARMIARASGWDESLVHAAPPVTGGPRRPARSWLQTDRLASYALGAMEPVSSGTISYLKSAGLL